MIGLNMIVRDEAAVIQRCLESARELIEEWTIVDTGSDDDTPEIIRTCLDGIPGGLHERPWRDFGSNRTEAIELARGTCDYHLLLDADDELVIAREQERPSGADVYWLEVQDGGHPYRQPRLIADRIPWHFVGPTHEYLDGPWETREQLDAIVIRHHCDGSRRPRKFEEDAALLADRVLAQPWDARSVFYLANTYRDQGRYDDAIRLYLRRASMNGWEAERETALQAAFALARGDTTPLPLPA